MADIFRRVRNRIAIWRLQRKFAAWQAGRMFFVGLEVGAPESSALCVRYPMTDAAMAAMLASVQQLQTDAPSGAAFPFIHILGESSMATAPWPLSGSDQAPAAAERAANLLAARATFAKAAADLKAAELAGWGDRPLFGDEAARQPSSEVADFAALCTEVQAIRRILEEQGRAVRLVSRVIGAA